LPLRHQHIVNQLQRASKFQEGLATPPNPLATSPSARRTSTASPGCINPAPAMDEPKEPRNPEYCIDRPYIARVEMQSGCNTLSNGFGKSFQDWDADADLDIHHA
jgi:hypothetical protein